MNLGQKIASLPENLNEEDLKKLITEIVEFICERQNLSLAPQAKEELIAGLTQNLLSKSQGNTVAKEALLDNYYRDRPSMNFLQLVTLSLALTLTLAAKPELKNTLSALLISPAVHTHALEMTRGELQDLHLLTNEQKMELRAFSQKVLNELEQNMALGSGRQNQKTVDDLAVALLGLVANVAGAVEADKTSIKSVIFQFANTSIDPGSSLTPESARDKPELQLSTGIAALFAEVLDTLSVESIKDHMNASTPRLKPPSMDD